MSNIIDSIKLSGVTYTIQGSGGGGNPTVELTQAQYDALVTAGTVSADTYYIITDAQGGDLSNYMTSAQTMSAITEATSGKVDSNVYTAYTASTDTAIQGKQDTLVSGTNIKTINNESLLGSGNITIQGGGGKAIEAGRGITVTTGETADTVSFNLPISAGTGSNSIAEGDNTTASGNFGSHAEGYHTIATGYGAHAEGNNTTASGNYSHAEGNQTAAKGNISHAEGILTIANNLAEHASGRYNNSVSASTTFGDSGNTLFSVGNGIADNIRHNAFEIRQNGDIYLTLDGQDVKLQDQLGGGGTVDQTIISGSTNAVAGGAVYNKLDEVEQVTSAALNNINDRLSEDEEVTAAGLNALNDKFGGLKLVSLTQAEYNALATKDASTLYIIVN